MEEKILLEADGIYKSFGATKALKGVELKLHEGEVMALIGENGSGKSTLAAAITGAVKKDGGTVKFLGKPFEPETILESRSKGIAVLAQELGTISGMTAAENIFLGMEKEFGCALNVQRKKMNQAAKEILVSVGAGDIDPKMPVEKLSFETRKLIEVARAMYHKPDVLIVDETTTALSQKGRDMIYRIIETMKKEKKGVIFISHDLEEVQKVCDTAEILRDGVYITKLSGDDVTPDHMRKHMIGRELTGHYYREETGGSWEKTVVLDVKNISKGILKDISFQLHKGEILGLGGLTECGMHELCKILYGADKPEKGTVTVCADGKVIRSTTDAMKAKIAYLPKDRDQESLFMTTSIRDNITVASLGNMSRKGFISPKKEKELAKKMSGRLEIKMRDMEQQVKELSGGNKQKVVVAKWLANDSEILIMDCPTRGIDIGVKASIYGLMEELKKAGKSIIMVSEEMPELIGMSDRILIMKDGRMTGEFARESVTEQMLIQKII